jgi:hypothetical protein
MFTYSLRPHLIISTDQSILTLIRLKNTIYIWISKHIYYKMYGMINLMMFIRYHKYQYFWYIFSQNQDCFSLKYEGGLF